MRLALLLIPALVLSCDAREVTPSARPSIIADGKPTHVTHDISGVGRITVVEVPVGGTKHATEYQTCVIYQNSSHFGFQCPNDRRSYSLDPPTN